MAKLLIVDDEEKIREMIFKFDTHEGHECVMACDVKEALDIFSKEDFDLVILDVMMPEMDGYETLKKMKQIKDVPCIFLTALGQEYDRIYGFDIGAEDYVTKPFSPKELMMRIKVVCERNSAHTNEKYIFDTLIIDKDGRMVTIDGEKVMMTPKELDLLIYMVENKNIALGRDKLLSAVWEADYYEDDRTIDTHIKMLRKDLCPYAEHIVTIRGMGYKFEV